MNLDCVMFPTLLINSAILYFIAYKIFGGKK